MMITTTQEWKIGDCKDVMHEMDANSVDLIVTDPPYGYSFMGKDWDKAVPSIDIWQECLHILKPGAFAFIMSAPRQDVLAHNLVNLSDAGFETGFTSIYWTFASGFPKAGNVSKLIDKRFGAEREVIGNRTRVYGYDKNYNNSFDNSNFNVGDNNKITAPSTPHAKALDGSYAGFQPKPAIEVVMVVMKPLSEKTYIDQALVNGKGITWLDDGRMPFDTKGEPNIRLNAKNHITSKLAGIECFNKIGDNDRSPTKYRNEFLHDLGNLNSSGRFPANLLVSDDVLNDGVDRQGKWGVSKAPRKDSIFLGDKYGQDRCDACNAFIGDSGSFSRYFDLDAWWDERIKHLPKEAQKTFPFMIVPKASKREKGKDNKHPTVKPVKLFSWLITIGSREGDLVVDPFLGSGVTLAAGRMTNRNVVGIEIDPQWEHLYADRCLKNTPPLQSYFGGNPELADKVDHVC